MKKRRSELATILAAKVEAFGVGVAVVKVGAVAASIGDWSSIKSSMDSSSHKPNSLLSSKSVGKCSSSIPLSS